MELGSLRQGKKDSVTHRLEFNNVVYLSLGVEANFEWDAAT